MSEGIIAVLSIMIIMLFVWFFNIPSALNPNTEPILVVAGNKTLLSQEIQIGQVTGSKILNDNSTQIQYKLGTWGFGWDDHETVTTITDEIFAPEDNVKIIESKIFSKDCKYYFKNGTEVIIDTVPMFTKTTGDYCGTSYKYEVELLK